MKKLTDKQIAKTWAEAERMAAVAAASMPGSFPTNEQLTVIAAAFLSSGMVPVGGTGKSLPRHGGATQDQEATLSEFYGDER